MPGPCDKLPRPIVILGPTAGGKSELAVTLAERIGALTGIAGEVLGADSMQLYRHMDAGTAKPTAEQRQRATHHLIDIVEPTERFTVADWLLRAEATIAQLQSRGVTPIVVGGTNLYIKALLEGMFEGPAVNQELRDRLNATPLDELRVKLNQVDPAAAARIHFNDRKRTVRALEVFEQTGKKISEMQQQWDGGDFGLRISDGDSRQSDGRLEDSRRHAAPPINRTDRSAKPEAPPLTNPKSEIRNPKSHPSPYRFGSILIGLAWPTDLINSRINARVKEMFFPAVCGLAHESLPDETARLEAAGLLGVQARKALGYQQVLDHLANPRKVTLDDAFEQTKILTRRFAKTQRTWLKRFREVCWLDASALSPAELADRAVTHVLASV